MAADGSNDRKTGARLFRARNARYDQEVARARNAFDERIAWLRKEEEKRGIKTFGGSERTFQPPHFYYCRPTRHLGMGKYRSYLCPAGLIGVEQIPKNWGLIWYHHHREKSQFTVQRKPLPFPNEEVNHHAGVEYLLKIMERLVLNIDNFQQAAAWGVRGSFVKVGS